LTTNAIDFLGTGGTGLRFGLYATSTDRSRETQSRIRQAGRRECCLTMCASYSQTLITGIRSRLLSGDPATHRGIIFTQVEPNFTLYTPYSSTSNVINNAASGAMAFPSQQVRREPLPPNSVEGILINGQTIVAASVMSRFPDLFLVPKLPLGKLRSLIFSGTDIPVCVLSDSSAIERSSAETYARGYRSEKENRQECLCTED